MALRNILLENDPTLGKGCKKMTDFNERLWVLLDDLKETLLDSGGIGLAAPQVGVLRRAVVVLETNVEEDEDERMIELVNPEIIFADGEQDGPEGCLSVPNVYGMVNRPMTVRIKAQDRYGEFFEIDGVGLTARAFCHELDHLEGILFLQLAERLLTSEELAEMMQEELDKAGLDALGTASEDIL